ncbi:cytoplasmic protein [Desulfobotulus sp. H1]|uniref:Cytoplasmic protein n=1 Tax=Desulfobotulus pelophilus TaxID=2823377 RepID=A0ABT3N6U0_9BACT|nr:cytoplasmic protein [Desulfobotulus pelophilus]MCW7753175.1 cytoplasmic protein [Desulfobotulus pelophilus]
MQKTALFVFNGDPMCFIHVLLNGLDMHERGDEVALVLEGSSTALIPELEKEAHPLHALWRKALDAEIVAGACRACCSKMKALQAAEKAGLSLLDDMAGHPSMTAFRDGGYTLLTF